MGQKRSLTPGASNRGVGLADGGRESSMEEREREGGGRKACWERCGECLDTEDFVSSSQRAGRAPHPLRPQVEVEDLGALVSNGP